MFISSKIDEGSSEHAISIQNNKINRTKTQVIFLMQKKLYQNVGEIILVLKLGGCSSLKKICHKWVLGRRIVLLFTPLSISPSIMHGFLFRFELGVDGILRVWRVNGARLQFFDLGKPSNKV